MIALNNLNPNNNMKLYSFLSNAWARVKIALLQLTRNVQTIIEALVYNHARSGNFTYQARPARPPIPEPCGPTLV